MVSDENVLWPTQIVSRETFDRLKEYEALLRKWQKNINLVSRETLRDLWQRHILDSAQLFPYLPEKEGEILDFGSGAGLPGVVLSILGFSQVTLVESNRKKTAFLKEVRRHLSLPYSIFEKRIEDLETCKANTITSRALASLADLLEYSYRFTTPETQLFFHKGQDYSSELKAAQKDWGFELDLKPSITSEDGVILILSGLYKKR